MTKVIKIDPVIEEQAMEKEEILNLPCNLENITRCLNSAFKSLKQVKDKNVIMAIGNTGCGKSTMLNALVYGTEVLQETTISFEVEVNVAKGGKKIKKKKIKVIDLKEEVKD